MFSSKESRLSLVMGKLCPFPRLTRAVTLESCRFMEVTSAFRFCIARPTRGDCSDADLYFLNSGTKTTSGAFQFLQVAKSTIFVAAVAFDRGGLLHTVY